MSNRIRVWSVIAVFVLAAVGGAAWYFNQMPPPVTYAPPSDITVHPQPEPFKYTAATPASAPSDRDVIQARKTIEQLDDPDFKIRETASLRMNSLDGSCLEVVESAFKDPNGPPETRLRLETALTFLRPRARIQNDTRLRENWLKKTLHEAYANGEFSDPKWDTLAHRAIDLAIPLGFQPLQSPASRRDAALDALADTIDAGCSDPFIKSLYGMCLGRLEGGGSSLDLNTGFSRDCREVLAKPYPDLVKLYACIGFLFVHSPADSSILTAPPALLENLAKQPDLPPGEIAVLADHYRQSLTLQSQGIPAAEQFAVRYERFAKPLDFNLFKAAHLMDRIAVSAAGDADDDKRDIAEADELATHAWELDPTDPRAPRLMMTLVLYQESGLDQRDEWFRRAAIADPDWIDIYQRKLGFLQGRYDEENEKEISARVLEFGGECLATQNWRGGIPQMIAEVHQQLSARSGDSRQYMSRPEVWADIQRAYEGGLLNFPEDVRRRTEYAKLAARCSHWGVANAQFKILGGRPDMGVMISQASYDYLRRKSERLAAANP